jgi:hypothetical protein
MATTTTLTMIPLTIYGEASGNYDGSSLDWHGDPVRAANYYQGQGHIQTVEISTTDFQGSIIIYATLDTWYNDPNYPFDPATPTTINWFEIFRYDNLIVPLTDYKLTSFQGNFTWLQARVDDFTAGRINTVKVMY